MLRFQIVAGARPAPSRPPGFTLVELLVVSAVTGLLIALLLPAVHAARQSARRAGCLHNLHQIGIGLLHHHAAVDRFPPGGIEHRMMAGSDGHPRGPAGRQLAWSVYLLPYLEQQLVFDQLDLTRAFDSPRNAAGAATVLPVYLCPSVSIGGRRQVDGRGACDYGGIYGERISGPNRPPKGVMLYDRAISSAEILDGTSHTLIVSEDSAWQDGQWINGLNVFDQAFAINAAPAFENDIRSQHRGGAHGLFCDGSVRFLAETIDLPTLAAICTRASAEAIRWP